MNDTDRYIPDAIEVRAWPGFHTAAEVNGMIGDIPEEDATESPVRAEFRGPLKFARHAPMLKFAGANNA